MVRVPILAALLLCAGTAAAQDWGTFNGDLGAQKFSPLTEITPANVGELEVAWRTHTGDVWPRPGGPRPSHRHGLVPNADTPPTVWSATPLFVNDTVYVGTPFYRIFALEPDTGAVRWSYDSHAVLEALTQPAADSLQVCVDVLEPLGSQNLLTMRVNNQTLKVTTHPDFPARMGENIWLRFPVSKIRWINKHTGQALMPAV